MSLAIRLAAQVMIANDIFTAKALRLAAGDADQLKAIEGAWLLVPGQKSGITWHYVQMLAGIPGIKPDRMITRFVASTLGLPRNSVKPKFALEALMAAAAEIGVSPSDLDHGIWQWQRRR